MAEAKAATDTAGGHKRCGEDAPCTTCIMTPIIRGSTLGKITYRLGSLGLDTWGNSP